MNAHSPLQSLLFSTTDCVCHEWATELTLVGEGPWVATLTLNVPHKACMLGRSPMHLPVIVSAMHEMREAEQRVGRSRLKLPKRPRNAQ